MASQQKKITKITIAGPGLTKGNNKRPRDNGSTSVDSSGGMDRSSTLPLVQVEEPEDLPRAGSRVIHEDTKVGDWQTRFSYCKVTKWSPFSQEVINTDRFSYTQEKSIPQSESYSASRYRDEIEVTRTEIAHILATAGFFAFTVCFFKQLESAVLADRILELDKDDPKFKTKKGDFSKRKFVTHVNQMNRGDLRTLVGHLKGGFVAQEHSVLGRAVVIDLEITDGHNERQVDYREIQWLILRGVKYTVKKTCKRR